MSRKSHIYYIRSNEFNLEGIYQYDPMNCSDHRLFVLLSWESNVSFFRSDLSIPPIIFLSFFFLSYDVRILTKNDYASYSHFIHLTNHWNSIEIIINQRKIFNASAISFNYIDNHHHLLTTFNVSTNVVDLLGLDGILHFATMQSLLSRI